ncbi:MAG: hypothetical protein R2719_03500 [Micropruina sp.]
MRASTGPALLAEAVHAALTSAATRHGVLAVIEDAHWADHSSRDLLTLLMTRGFSGPVGLVVSYRSDDLHRRHPLHATLGVWARLSEVTRLHLDPLPDPTMADLVHDLTDADEDAVARIVERAAGNPFFAEELVASGNELGTDLGRVLRTRFEQLDAGTRTVVRAAAVMGRPLDHDLLQAVVDLSPDDLDAALASAIDQHILERVGGDAYGFRHALVAEAIGDDLLPGQRRRLHAAFATALRAHPSLCTASDLARHAAASGDLETAVTAGIDAGESAWSLGGPREAATLFEQVLDWMTDDDPRRDDATAQAALAAAASGDVTRGVHLVRDRLAHSRAEDAARARLLAAYVTLARLLEDPSEVPGLLDRAREALRLTEDSPTAAGCRRWSPRSRRWRTPTATWRPPPPARRRCGWPTSWTRPTWPPTSGPSWSPGTSRRPTCPGSRRGCWNWSGTTRWTTPPMCAPITGSRSWSTPAATRNAHWSTWTRPPESPTGCIVPGVSSRVPRDGSGPRSPGIWAGSTTPWTGSRCPARRSLSRVTRSSWRPGWPCSPPGTGRSVRNCSTRCCPTGPTTPCWR